MRSRSGSGTDKRGSPGSRDLERTPIGCADLWDPSWDLGAAASPSPFFITVPSSASSSGRSSPDTVTTELSATAARPSPEACKPPRRRSRPRALPGGGAVAVVVPATGPSLRPAGARGGDLEAIRSHEEALRCGATAAAAVTVLSGSCSVAESPRIVGTLPTSGVMTLQRLGTPVASMPLGAKLLPHLPPPCGRGASGGLRLSRSYDRTSKDVLAHTDPKRGRSEFSSAT